MAFKTLDDADLAGQRALVRVDINVPTAEGKVTDDTRLRAILPTIAKLRAGGAKVILLAHFDRPKGKVVPEMSLKPLAQPLADLLDAPVAFAADCIGEAAKAAVEGLK
ncbi:MAG: phosphoglycerate kinase, partial [Phenylobacterium sp.]